MSEAASDFNIKGLEQLLKSIKQAQPICRVGILGANASATHGKGTGALGKALGKGGGPTNYEIGLVHEYGSQKRGIPQRSFLRQPIAENLQKFLVKSDFFTEDTLKEVLKDGSVIAWMRGIAASAKAVVLEGFATGGFGKWPAWKNANYKNNTGMLLQDTTQLRKSITDEVKERG